MCRRWSSIADTYFTGQKLKIQFANFPKRSSIAKERNVKTRSRQHDR